MFDIRCQLRPCLGRRSRPRLHPRRGGFTLIEMLLVLVILSIMMAMAAPSLGGWGDTAKLRNAGDDFISATQWARSRAIVSATKQVLTVDSSAGSFLVAADTANAVESTPIAGEFSQPTVLPNLFQIEMLSGGEEGAIAFYPNGRSTPAVVRITSAKGATVLIGSSMPAEPFGKIESN